MEATIIAKTEFLADATAGVMSGFRTDVGGGEALAEAAGRACYQSFSRPNPATATNAGYIKHIIDVGHESVLEHGSVTFYITGISRSLTHELIRHRHLSYSQLSQRYVNESESDFIIPKVIDSDDSIFELFDQATSSAQKYYNELVEKLEDKYKDEPNKTLRRKLARQAARSVLPNATETRIVVTGNYRAWRHFITLRATEHADVEIRELAVEILRQLQGVASSVFSDYEISSLPDGSEVASSSSTDEG